MRILIIEDDKDLCGLLAHNLKIDGYSVDACFDGDEGLALMSEQIYDGVLLDRMLPELDGLTLLKLARQRGITTPVIMITALDQLPQVIEGLDGGADDYLAKPFAMDELLARIRALVRRPREMQVSDVIACGDISLDKTSRKLTCGDIQTSVSKRECDLLDILMKHFNKTLPRAMIFSYVWGAHSEVENGNLDNYISYIRDRLKEIGSQLSVKTVRGVGYRLEDHRV